MGSPAIRLTQLDGELPNLALMKLAHWHRAQGHQVTFTRTPERGLFEPEYDVVYGSAIFTRSAPLVKRLRRAFPAAVVGGTGTGYLHTVEQMLDVPEYEHYDYTDYPDFEPSVGFTQRGCRLRCGFCVVPKKEGKNRSVNTIADIWRGPGHPKKIMDLANDFLGQPREQWEARIAELNDGGFHVCWNQGLNVRLISAEGAAAIATVEYRDKKFRERRLYTAWDNLRDERIFFRGVDILEAAGIPPKHLMVYMLVGYDPAETMERIFERFTKMVARGVLPYPMVYDARQPGTPGAPRSIGALARTETPEARYRVLKRFQRWVTTGLYRDEETPFEAYDPSRKGRRRDKAAQLALSLADPC